jgi:hypothetical protein
MPATETVASDPAPARHPLVERILAGGAPDAIRLSAARGALPIPGHDRIYLQIRLLQDPLQDVAGAAGESLAAVQEDVLLPLLGDPACDPLILDHFARSGRLTGATLAATIAHPSISDATLDALATSAGLETLNLIVTNEVRIINRPRLLELLRANPELSPENRRRLAELERDFIGKEPLDLRSTAPAETVPLPGPEAGVPIEEVPEEQAPPPEGEESAIPPMTPEEEAAYEESLRRTPAFQRIMKMNVADRVQLAMKGNAEERAILVRDTAKMVANQVLKSPKLSDNEIATFANMRNVSEDILRTIAARREWTKNYGVAHALVRNPKTPSGVSVQFLPRLGTRDLKIVAGDKNIPEMVRRHARNLFLVRTQPPKKRGKKGH